MTLNSHNFEGIYEELGIDLNKLGCIMADIEPLESMTTPQVHEGYLFHTTHPDRKWINGWVAGEVAHITLLYGLLENGHTWKKYVDQVLDGWELAEVEIDHVGYFDSPYKDEDYYCIVAHMKITPELLEGHQRLQFLPHINTFPGYKGHMTICYIKKDEQMRDGLIEGFNSIWKGKKMAVSKKLNYGYLPKKD